MPSIRIWSARVTAPANGCLMHSIHDVVLTQAEMLKCEHDVA